MAPFYAFGVRVDYPLRWYFSGGDFKEVIMLILFKTSVQWCSGQHNLRRHSGKRPAIAREAHVRLLAEPNPAFIFI